MYYISKYNLDFDRNPENGIEDYISYHDDYNYKCYPIYSEVSIDFLDDSYTHKYYNEEGDFIPYDENFDHKSDYYRYRMIYLTNPKEYHITYFSHIFKDYIMIG